SRSWHRLGRRRCRPAFRDSQCRHGAGGRHVDDPHPIPPEHSLKPRNLSMSIFRIQRPWFLFAALAALVVTASTVSPVTKANSISSSSQQAAAYAIDPPLGIAGAAPLVMLNLSRDHQLFYKAYNDFTDIDNNGTIDTTFNHSFTYAGYFDPTKCYQYGSGYFAPKTATTTGGYCSQKMWSGNFLNWATMSRMDEVRKILYGGKRSQDTTVTILERAFLPTDAHSFAKFYNGSDISQLTPYSPPAPAAVSNTSATYNYDTVALNENGTDYTLLRLKKVPTSLLMQVGDQIRIEASKTSTYAANGPRFEAPVRNLNSGTGNNYDKQG